ncbi:MAG TPA: hypothetical protein VNQ90_03075 [Chthoniobacteraceae bacterium]|nr:hypothetical protein [Chthoniobacteraceae bacterium]
MIPLTRRERVVLVVVLIFVLIGVTVRQYRQAVRAAEVSAGVASGH